MPRRLDPRVALRAAALLALAVLATLGLDRGPGWSGLAATPVAPAACAPDDGVTWRRADGDAVDPAATTLLASNALLTTCAPGAGTLALTLRGTVGGGVGTRAVLVQGAARLLDVELRDETRTLEVAVPAAGPLVLAFVNDFYAPPEDRNLWVSGLAFTPRSP